MQNVILKQEDVEEIIVETNNDLNKNRCLNKLPENRCKVCNRLLFLGKVQYVEIKCPKCNRIVKIGKNVNKICIKD